MKDQHDAGLLSPVRAGTEVEEAVSDRAWLQAMLDAEAALARAQARLGTVPHAAAAVITRLADADRFDLRALALAARESANPVVPLVQELTRQVAAAHPAAAPYVHRGSTSQDVFDTAAMLVSSRALAVIRRDLAATADALAVTADRHHATAMAGRTLALQAVPTTFGLKAAGWRHLVLESDQRIDRVASRGLPTSLGGAAGTLAGYREYARIEAAGQAEDVDYLDRLEDAFAQETGLARAVLPWHALRTPLADLAACLAFTAGSLGKIALDVQTLSRTEIGEVSEPAAAGRGASSAMPHKQNPVLATLIRSASLQVPALATALTQCLLAEDERSGGAWHAEWNLLRECLRLVGGAAHTAVQLTRGLRTHPDVMARNLTLTTGQIVSERLAAHLAAPLGRTEAKHLLTEASTAARLHHRPLAEILAGDPRVTAHLDATEIEQLCEPAHYTGYAAALTARALAPRDRHPADEPPQENS